MVSTWSSKVVDERLSQLRPIDGVGALTVDHFFARDDLDKTINGWAGEVAKAKEETDKQAGKPVQ